MRANPQIKIHKNKKTIIIFECFARNSFKLACFVPLLAFF